LSGLVIDSQRHKTKKHFSVPIPRWVADLLELLPNDDPNYFFWHRRSDGTALQRESIAGEYGIYFRKAFAEAGIVGGHSHQLRHSFATYHLAHKVPVEQVAEWMGDSQAEVLRTYAHWIPERREVSMQAMQDSYAVMGLDEVGNPLPSVAKTGSGAIQ
jgi:integrase